MDSLISSFCLTEWTQKRVKRASEDDVIELIIFCKWIIYNYNPYIMKKDIGFCIQRKPIDPHIQTYLCYI